VAAGHNERPRARAWAAAVAQARRRAGFGWPADLGAGLARLRGIASEWALAEVAPGRLLPWLPVAFGFGIVLYFTAAHEPAWWAASVAALAGTALSVAARRSSVGLPLALGFAALAAGFAAATLQTQRIAHPVLQFGVSSAALAGFVEVREERERSDRVVIRLTRLEGARIVEKPERVRIAVRKGTAPAVGAFVELKAHLSPPLQPLRPGGYDFARDMYFQRIGASGYALGKIKTVPAQAAPGVWLGYASVIDGMRESINRRIRAVLAGDRGSIASALITGKRGAISAPVNDAFYVSSLAHVLAISGYHMAVVAGVAFFFIRAGLALFPALAVRRPIKKWAAAGALMMAAFYLVLSGASVSTQRAFIMIAIVLIGIMVDRPTLTFRTISIAAFAVLLLSPQAIVTPSFQMSFAAALALIAAYQYGLPFRADADSSLSARAAVWGGREIASLLMAALVAGLATTPYAAFHFHRLAPYGVIANLLAMPVVSALVMPMGILGVLMTPFGFDGVFWHLMGIGIDWMIAVVLWVANLPGAVGRIQAFGTGPLLTGTAGLLIVCLLRSPLRWSGAVLALAASLWAIATPRPDILVSGEGQAAAIRGPDGRLSVLHTGRDTFAVREWLAADADGRNAKDASLKDGVACDEIGCVGRLADGRRVAMPLSAEAFTEDCMRAAVVVSPRGAPGACAATLVDRRVWRAHGAMALRWIGDRFEQSDARPNGYDRPWAKALATASTGAPAHPRPRDATPKAGDLEPGD